ncbi:uncharacterized protein LOC117893412 [Drosophila subobscura]|uniref:uncharacterized protein LOC117893412 n=1 Tax=Drosophila subobscura TaxID=7241 RepID=UPI00155A84DF|nr:uncharacterized protein LOC117893412 [Drosophila subobscura]
MEVQRSIIDLPLNVLEMVFQLLNHSNKLHLAQSDRVLAEAYASHTRSIYKRMHLSYALERRIPWADVLAICGANVVEIVNRHALADYQLKIIELHCPNLQVVSFEIKDENCAGLKSLLESLKEQATVRLRIGESATPKIYNMMQQLPRLDRLSLDRISFRDDVTIRGSDIRYFKPCKWFSKYSPALETLKLFQAHPERNDFLAMLRGCKKLRFLVIDLKNLQITKELLATITGILKENGVTPDKPLQLKVNVHKKVKNVKLKDLLAETPNADLLHLC